MLNTIRKFAIVAALVISGHASPVNAVPPPDASAIRACERLAEDAYRSAVREAQVIRQKAAKEAEDAYKQAMYAAKGDEAKQLAAKRAKQLAMRDANRDAQEATRAAQRDKVEAFRTCRNPKPPETTNNSSSNNNSKEGTLGHGPRGRNPSVRMDLRVVDETGKPVQGVKTKLWSERQSNGFLCETFHTTDALGRVLMDPIHFTKTLQLKLEARGFAPQMVQVDPAQLDRPFKAVMQAK